MVSFITRVQPFLTTAVLLFLRVCVSPYYRSHTVVILPVISRRRRCMTAFVVMCGGGMRNDVRKYCNACLECASWRGGRRTCHPPLQPIPVGGPFHRVAVDILQLPTTSKGNRYVTVFMDYLTKWREAFAIPDQRAETIAKLFVEQIASTRHSRGTFI